MSTLSQIKVSAFYVAVFNRAPDHQGLNYWLNQIQGLGEGATYSTLASQFAQHPVFAETYSNLTDVGFVEALYTNILGQAGDSNGVAYWVNKLGVSVGMTRVQVLTQFVQDAVTVDLTTGAAAWGLTQEEWEVAVARQNYLFNKAEVGVEFASRLVADSNMSPSTVTTTLAGLMADPAYVASIDILKGVTNESSTLLRAKDLIQQAVGQEDPLAYISANASDAPTGPIYFLTEGSDQFPAGFGGDNGGNDHIYGANVPLTFNTSDVVDGGYGYDTLTLDLVAQTAPVNSGFVSDVERLDINAFEGDGSVTLRMTRFDDQLEQINIRTAQDDVSLLDQQSIAEVRLVDTVKNLSLDYDSQLVLGTSDHLQLAVDEVSSTITVGAGIDLLAVDVQDGRSEASTVNLVASTVRGIHITGGLSDQRATFVVDVASGASLNAEGFSGDLTLTSTDLRYVTTGAGDDIVTISGGQENLDATAHLGNGDNVLNMTVNANGSIVVGTGTDDINITGNFGGTAVLGSATTEVGSNTMDVSGVLSGQVTGTSGMDAVTSLGVMSGAVDLKNGANTLSVHTLSGTYTGGVNNDTVTVTTGGVTNAGTVNLGSANSEVGVNTLTVQSAAAIAGTVNGSSGADAVTATGSTVSGIVDLRNGTNILGAASLTGAYIGGTGSDTVTLTGTVDGTGNLAGTVTMGSGANALTAANLTNAVVTGLEGVDTLNISGVISGGTVDVGSGADVINVGTDASNVATLTGDAEVRTSSGADVVTIKGDVAGGALLDLGDSADTLNLAGSAANMPGVSGSNLLTEINLGSGADTMIITGSSNATDSAIVQSGSSISAGGNETGDVLTLQSVDNANLIARTAAQSLTFNFAKTDTANYLVGDVVSVVVAGTPYSYTVRNADIVQGDGVATSRNVALGLHAVLPEQFTLGEGTSSTFTYLGNVGDADKTITAAVNSTAVTPTIVQIANTNIGGFETLNLTALNATSGTDNEGETADLSVDIALTSGITTINLANQDDLVSVTTGSGSSAYITNSVGDANVFSLTNLNGNEVFTLTANEASATGNYQVDTVTISNAVGKHQIGDIVSVTIGDTRVSITVTQAELNPGNSAAADAALIAAKLAAAINAADVPLDAFVANNIVTLKGVAGADPVTVAADHTRPATFVVDSETLGHVDGFDIGNKVLVLDRDQNVGDTVDITYTIDGTTTVPGYDTSSAQELPFAVGDVIRVVVGTGQSAVTTEYVITQAALNAYCERGDTSLIAQGIAQALTLNGYTAAAVRGSLALDTDLPVTYTQTRGIDALVASSVLATSVQSPSDLDDDVFDTTILATLPSGDTGVDTFRLTVNGNDDYDIALGAELGVNSAFDSGSKYESLALALGGTGDYYIDTFGDEGNFGTQITITGGVAGQNVTLDYVKADVITSTSAANLTIDRQDLGDDSDIVVVTTGSGNDQLITDVEGLLNAGSSVNLGSGSNTLGVYYGSDGDTIDSFDLSAIGNISYTGNLDRLEIHNRVNLDGNTTLTMMGVAGQVDEILFDDVESSDSYNLTISRTATALTIESNDDFDLYSSDADAGLLTTAGVSDLTVLANDVIDFAVGSNLSRLTVTSSTDDVDLRLFDTVGAGVRSIGDITVTSGSNDEVNFWLQGLEGETITISTLNLNGGETSGDDADIETDGILNTSLTFGNVTLSAADADAFLNDSIINSHITIGNLVLNGADDAYSTNSVIIRSSTSEFDIASIQVTSNYSSLVDINNNNNLDLALGSVTLSSDFSDTDFRVNYNFTTNPTDDDQSDVGANISVGDVSLISCEADANLEINYNSDGTNEADLRITLGNVVMDADEDVYLDIYRNTNSTIRVGDITAAAGTFEDNNSDIYISIENNTVTEVSETNRITVGNVAATSYGSDAGSDLEISNNYNLNLTLGQVGLAAYGFSADVSFDISDSTGDTTITIGHEPEGEDPVTDALVLTATDNAYLDISDNSTDHGGVQADNTDIVIHGNVKLTAGSNAEFTVEYNGHNDVSGDADSFSLDIHGDVIIEAANQTLDNNSSGNAEFSVNDNDNFDINIFGDLTVSSTDNTGVFIQGNSSGWVAMSDVTVESLTAGAVDADLLVQNNVGLFLGMRDISVNSRSTDSVDGYASLAIEDNENSMMYMGEDFFGEDDVPSVSVIANAGDAKIIIDDNDNALISLGEDYFGEDDATEILVDSTSNNAFIEITDNGSDYYSSSFEGQRTNGLDSSDPEYDSYNLYEDYTVSTNIYLGDVEINAGQDSALTIDDNNGPDADVLIRVGDVNMNADRSAYVYIEADAPNNSDETQVIGDTVTYREATDQTIIVGDFDITALGASDSVGPTVDFFAASAFTTTDYWETKVPVDNGPYNANWNSDDIINPDYPGNTYVRLGDIDIKSGGSDSWVEVDLINIHGTERIEIQADYLGASDSMIELDGYYTYDLNTVILSGDDSNVYLAGEMGGISDDNGSFLLDMSNMTGGFNGGALNYDPNTQDDGNYIETYDALFDGTVNVILGSGDYIYNAAYTGMWGSDSDWSGDAGWYSLGQGSDWEPLPEIVTLSGFSRYFGNTGNESFDTDFVNVQFNQGNQSYLIVLSTVGTDFDDPSNNDDDDTLNNSTWDIYFRQEGNWVSVDTLTPGNGDDTDIQELALLAGLLGVKDVAINQVGYAGVEVVITGKDDGTAFTQIDDLVVSNDEGSGMAGVNADSTPDNGYQFPVIITSENGELALDAIGQETREVFTFTGDYVGEIVIGGFNPGSFNTFSPVNGRETDRLDFSQFDWNGDGAVNSDDRFDLSDFNFTIDDNDGFFKDVIVDFNDRYDLGSIRLVGVGEYTDAIELVQDSIYFG